MKKFLQNCVKFQFHKASLNIPKKELQTSYLEFLRLQEKGEVEQTLKFLPNVYFPIRAGLHILAELAAIALIEALDEFMQTPTEITPPKITVQEIIDNYVTASLVLDSLILPDCKEKLDIAQYCASFFQNKLKESTIYELINNPLGEVIKVLSLNIVAKIAKELLKTSLPKNLKKTQSKTVYGVSVVMTNKVKIVSSVVALPVNSLDSKNREETIWELFCLEANSPKNLDQVLVGNTLLTPQIPELYEVSN